MKLPAFLAGAGKGLRTLSGRASRIAGSLFEASGAVAERVAAGVGYVLRIKAFRIGLSIAGGVTVLIAAFIIGSMALRAMGPGTPAVPDLPSASGRGAAMESPSIANGSIPRMPASGPALASMLLIPDAGEWPYPLALEPKSRYTEDDAAPLRPDLAEVDVSGLIRRRKAELETMYGSVD